MPFLRFFLLVIVVASSAFAQAPAARPARRPVVLPEALPRVLADRRVAFSLRAPGATKVELALLAGATTPMIKGDKGDWSLTLGPLEPEIYRYTFLVDGLSIADPVNMWIDVGNNSSASVFEIPGSPARIDELRPGPQGTLHILRYHSTVLGVTRRVFVHTPVAYDREPARRFPVLYLRRGKRRPRKHLDRCWSRRRNSGQPRRRGRGRADDDRDAQWLSGGSNHGVRENLTV